MGTNGPDVRRGTWFLVALTVTACSGAGPSGSSVPTASPDADSAPARSEQSVALLERTLAEDEPGCSAAVGVEGEVAWAGARGVADVRTGDPLDETTTFHVGSVSKQFTATAVLLLELDGRLDLDDPVGRWVPGLPGWSGEVTLAQLITHTSGIPDFLEPMLDDGVALADRVTQQDVLAVIGDLEPASPPGARGEYSNSGYVLLAEVVRAADGRPLPEFLRDRVFGPLELDMVLDPAATSPDESDPRTASGHERDDTGRGWQPTGARWALVGPGFLQTTPSELVRWADNYRTGDVGGEALLHAQVAEPVEVRPGLGYAAGIFVDHDGELRHDGGWAGQIADFAVSADRRAAVAVACNYETGSTADLRHIADNLRALWFR